MFSELFACHLCDWQRGAKPVSRVACLLSRNSSQHDVFTLVDYTLRQTNTQKHTVGNCNFELNLIDTHSLKDFFFLWRLPHKHMPSKPQTNTHLCMHTNRLNKQSCCRVESNMRKQWFEWKPISYSTSQCHSITIRLMGKAIQMRITMKKRLLWSIQIKRKHLFFSFRLSYIELMTWNLQFSSWFDYVDLVSSDCFK